MTSYIDPRCGKQIYTMESEDEARSCGKLSGIVTTALLSAIFLCIGVWMWYESDKITDPVTKAVTIDPKGKSYKPLISTIACIACMTLIFPWFFGWLSSRNWLSYDQQIKGYTSGGMSRQDAIRQIQNMQQTQIQADATLSGAAMIANAFSSKRK